MEINLSARDLRAFLAVADTLSFSQAAQQMHLSQSALSTLIGRLEDGFGARLFDRTTRSVALRPPARCWPARAAAAGRYRAHRGGGARRDGAAARPGGAGRLAVAGGAHRAAPVPRLSRRAIPDIDAVAGRHAVRTGVRAGARGPRRLRHHRRQSGLQRPRLHPADDRRICAAGRARPSAGPRQRPVRLPDTLPYPHISMSRHTSVRQYVDAAALQAAIDFYPAFEVDHLATIGAMVAEELGVAALPAMAADVIDTGGLVRRRAGRPRDPALDRRRQAQGRRAVAGGAGDAGAADATVRPRPPAPPTRKRPA